jgi:hypothetical protein
MGTVGKIGNEQFGAVPTRIRVIDYLRYVSQSRHYSSHGTTSAPAGAAPARARLRRRIEDLSAIEP